MALNLALLIMEQAHGGIFEIIHKLEHGEFEIEKFDTETLFINIYYYYNFVRFLSPYTRNYGKVLSKLKKNIIEKWRDELPNVWYFLKLLKKKSKDIDPNGFFYNSEDYFVKLLNFFKDKKIVVNRRKIICRLPKFEELEPDFSNLLYKKRRRKRKRRKSSSNIKLLR